MEAIYFVVVLGVVGGALLAFALLKFPRRPVDPVAAVVAARQPLVQPGINYSSMKVSGIGGFGMVLACVVIAIEIPDIRRSMIAAISLGAIMAALLVFVRRGHPLPSSDASAGANTTLRIDE